MELASDLLQVVATAVLEQPEEPRAEVITETIELAREPVAEKINESPVIASHVEPSVESHEEPAIAADPVVVSGNAREGARKKSRVPEVSARFQWKQPQKRQLIPGRPRLKWAAIRN